MRAIGVNCFSRAFEHRGIALSPAPVWYARAGVADRDAEGGGTVNGFWRTFHHRGIASAVTADRVWSVLIAFHRPGAAEARRCEARRARRSPLMRSVERTCDGHAKSSPVRRDGYGGARAPPSIPTF